MADRVARSQGAEAALPRPESGSPRAAGQALLVQRRARPPAGAPARMAAHGVRLPGAVVRPVPDADGWVVVDEWLPAERLAPA
jgi:hypothetical protein